jgi:hypothetical protein
MSTHTYLYTFMAEDATMYPEDLSPSPTIDPSRETLETLEQNSRNNIPLLGHRRPDYGPVPSSIRALWDRPTEPSPVQSLLPGSTPLPMPKGNLPCFGPIARPTQVPPATPIIVPVKGVDEPTEFLLSASGGARHDSASAATPVILPVEDGEEPTELSLDGPNTSPVHSEDESLPATDQPSTTSQVRRREEGSQALAWALRSVRSRRPQEWSEGLHVMLERRELEGLLRVISLADRGEAEW